MATTDYNELIGKGVLFNLAELEEKKLIKKDMANKLIDQGKLEVVRIGVKLHISRTELIRYLEEQTTARTA